VNPTPSKTNQTATPPEAPSPPSGAAETASSRAAQHEAELQQLRQRLAPIRLKILVLSGKGGVGKSTVAANLASSLSLVGCNVGLLDIDIHGPSIPKILGLEGESCRPSPDPNAIEPVVLGPRLKVMSIGFLLQSPKDAVVWRGPLKYKVIEQFLRDVNWGDLDVLVIDSPPGTGDEPLSVAQLVGRPAAAIVVTTPQEVAVADVRRSVSFCQQLHLDVLGIVENMSGFVCPHCGQTTELFKSGGGSALAQEMGVPFLGRIPFDPQVVVSGDAGTPFVHRFAESPAAHAFEDIVRPILLSLQREEPQPSDTEKSSLPTEKPKHMKIAIPLTAGRLSGHFGHCEEFALIEADPGSKQIVNQTRVVPPPHEPGVLPRWLHEQGAQVIIAGGMGRRALDLFAENGIAVHAGPEGASPEDLVQAFLNGALGTAAPTCGHDHGHHGHRHGHHHGSGEGHCQ